MMTAKELAVRRWAMKQGQTMSERAVLFALGMNGGTLELAEIRAAVKEYKQGVDRPINVRPALASLQQKGQVRMLVRGGWRLV